MASPAEPRPPLPTPPERVLETSDEELVERVRQGDRLAFELLMRRNNRRVYRAVRAVLRDGADVEEVMQQTYTLAFSHLDQFQGNARWSTWVCRIAFNEALARVRQRGRFVSIDADAGESVVAEGWRAAAPDPERQARAREMGRLVEETIDGMPDIYRSVMIFREIEGLTTLETAEILAVEENVVKTRLHRARALLRDGIERRIGRQVDDAYAFEARRCDRVVTAVLARLVQIAPPG
jgi:RNA polymerase sigma-70 factor (ECF subfamily)